MAFFQKQNERMQGGTLDGVCAKYLNLDTLGLTNACIDSKIETPFYPEFAVNNTYGLQTITEDVYREAVNNITKEGGCSDLTDACRSLAASDPENVGTNDTVNAACASATQYCFQFVQGAYTAVSGVSTISASITINMPRVSNRTSGVHLTYRETSFRSSHPNTSWDI
jgi:hypothetical protein